MSLKIEYVPIDQLDPYDKNARKHEDTDIRAIAESIQQFGFNDPIGVWHNTIVEGHGRLLAAKRLGMTKVPVIYLDHLTDEQRRAYALAHNKIAELSMWDFDVLNDELNELTTIDMSKFGFEDTEMLDSQTIDDLFSAIDSPAQKEPKQIQCPYCGEWFTR